MSFGILLDGGCSIPTSTCSGSKCGTERQRDSSSDEEAPPERERKRQGKGKGVSERGQGEDQEERALQQAPPGGGNEGAAVLGR